MLGHLEIDMEVSDAGMKIVEFNDYKEVSGDDRDANGVLAVTWKRATFFPQRWTEVYQSIYLVNELYQVSQLYPRTKEQEESSRVI